MEEIVVGAKRVAMGDWMGDPDVTLGLGREAVWDGGKYAVGAELRWSRVGRSSRVRWGWCLEGGGIRGADSFGGLGGQT